MKKKPKHKHDPELLRACRTVERHARSLGPDCQIVFLGNAVEIALLSDAGSTVGPDLYTTLKDAVEQKYT